jgi:hypothetical protein
MELILMTAIDEAFFVVTATYGSGWKGISVGIRNAVRPVSLGAQKNLWCVTDEAISEIEWSRGIDELIAQLEKLKRVGRKRLAEIASNSTE